ncbi:MAG: hypothetical protein M0Z80_04100 [Treponema sp.]|nr:hypothetical protein [Treponema sp.]
MPTNVLRLAQAALVIGSAASALAAYLAPLPGPVAVPGAPAISASPSAVSASAAASPGAGREDAGPDGRVPSPATAPDPEAVVRVFLRARPAFGAAKAAAPKTPPADRSREPAGASWLRAVGSLEDTSGMRWLFFKDERRGRVLRLRGDGSAGEGGSARIPARLVSDETERYVLEVDGETLWVGKARR